MSDATLFGEAAILDDGRRVVAPWGQRGVYIGDRFIDGPQLRMPDAALDTRGRVWIVGKDQSEGAWVLLDTVGVWWPVPAPIFGSRMVLCTKGTDCHIAYTNSPSEYRWVQVSDTGVMSEILTRPIPTGEGAQGMRDWVAGVPRPMAPLDAPLSGVPARAAVTSGLVTIACALSGPDQVLMDKAGVLGTLLRGGIDWPTPRLSQHSGYWVGVRYAPPAIVGGKVPDTPPPLQTEPPHPPTPVPPGGAMTDPKITVKHWAVVKDNSPFVTVELGNGITLTQWFEHSGWRAQVLRDGKVTDTTGTYRKVL